MILNVTVITDGRVRKVVVMSSPVSLVISLLKELISVMAVSKTVSLVFIIIIVIIIVIIILEQYSSIPMHFSGCYILFQMTVLAFCDK